MTAKRVHYREHQILKDRDLRDEQAYRICMRRRHNLAYHGLGIVQGLTLETDPRGVFVRPGLAADGYGRELIVSRDLLLKRSIFDEVLDIAPGYSGTDYVDVWLTYCLRPSEYWQPDQAARQSEEALLKLACANPDRAVDPYHPTEVPLHDLGFQPQRELPDDPEREWPVYLGRVCIVTNTSTQTYTLKAMMLAYAKLTGASIRAPWGDTWMQIGDQEARDKRRFAISLPNANAEPTDRILLGQGGDATLRGTLRVRQIKRGDLINDGDLGLIGTANELPTGSGVELGAVDVAPELAAPWQLYRTSVKQKIKQQELSIHQLRFETFNPGEDEGDPARFEWIIGDAAREDDPKKYPIMTVRSDNKVIVNGSLWIQGQLIEGAIPPDLDDQRFRDQILSGWTKGLTAAGTEVDAFYELPLDVELEILSITPAGGGKDVEYRVKIENTSLINREVPILAVIGEFRDAQRLLVHSESLNLDELQWQTQKINNPITEGAAGELRKITHFDILQVLTLTVRVIALGSAQNTVEKQANAVVNLEKEL